MRGFFFRNESSSAFTDLMRLQRIAARQRAGIFEESTPAFLEEPVDPMAMARLAAELAETEDLLHKKPDKSVKQKQLLERFGKATRYENPGAYHLILGLLETLSNAANTGKVDPALLANTIVGTIAAGEVGAACKVCSDGSRLILIHQCTLHFVNLLIRIFLQVFPLTRAESGGLSMSPLGYYSAQQPGCSAIVRFRLEDLFDSYIFSGDPTAALPYLEPTSLDGYFVHWLHGAELFILCHELAHLNLRHNDQTEDIHAQEFEADRWAL